MAEISISLNNIQNIKTVNIEGIGVFRVRKLGAGEELDMSLKMRRLMKVLAELREINLDSYDLSKKSDREKFAKEEKRINKLSDEVTEIRQFELATYKRCFTDDKGGKNVDLLINSLTDEERSELFKQIFGEAKVLEAPESTTPEETEVKNG